MANNSFFDRNIESAEPRRLPDFFSCWKIQGLAAATVLIICLGISVTGGQLAGEEIGFNRDVRAILSNHCFTCHGPDATQRESGLRLDQRTSAVGEADSGNRAIVPNDAASSEMILRITSEDKDHQMPPPGGKALSPKQIDILKQWVNNGARYEQHWAFVVPTVPEQPTVENRSWPRNEIDFFVLSRLEKSGLQPSAEANRETLIRRVAFDLTGLPPTVEEIDQFLDDPSPKAYPNMIERYLKSPSYGEHMARHWLDLARYADTNGYQYDTERQQWVWRDWVIEAYNQNMPFDQFTLEQIAGDLLPQATPQQRLATGFNRNHGITIEGGIIDEEYRTEYVMDRVSTTGEVWLGMTLGCARCHDHKFDPVSQREFYEIYHYFNQVPERGMNGFQPMETITSPLGAAQNDRLSKELAGLQSELQKPFDPQPKLNEWVRKIRTSGLAGWRVLKPISLASTGGSTFIKQPDDSFLVGGANPAKDIYDISTHTFGTNLTAVRLEALTHASLPAGGPGRHSNSNFVLSEIELTATSILQPTLKKKIRFSRAIGDYSQVNYEVSKAIDGTVAGNNGWAVDGPTRKANATALLIAEEPFGFSGGTELKFRLRHEASFATHGIGRPRLSITSDPVTAIDFRGIPVEIIQITKTPNNKQTIEQKDQVLKYFLQHHDPRQIIRERISAIEKERSMAYPATMIMKDLPNPRKSFVLNRGQYNQPTDEVQPGVPAVFPTLPKNSPPNRLGFAQWLVDPTHPLTARVAVNRYWQRLFGTGMVKTAEDFGIQGELPSHPLLLDWLAIRFRESGWDIKEIHRLILQSATYRQASSSHPESFRTDPGNRLLSRGPRMRLDGEEIRDAALLASGLLSRQIGGKSVYPYQPAGLWLELNNRPGLSKTYPQGTGNDLVRRSIYTFWKRTVPSPMLKTFDAPEREFCTTRRSKTNTPLQALLLLNGKQFVEAARYLGERMIQRGGVKLENQIRFGFRLTTSRMPSSSELALLLDTYRSELQRYSENPEAANKLLTVGDLPANLKISRAKMAAMTEVARLLLNLDEAISKG